MGEIASRVAAMRGCSLAQIVAEIARMEDGEPELFSPTEEPDDAFEVWWRYWPHKVAKKEAERSYRAARKKGWRAEDLLQYAERYIREKPADRPWMNGATFLNGERWKDQPAQQQPLRGAAAVRESLRRQIDEHQRGIGPQDPDPRIAGRLSDARVFDH